MALSVSRPSTRTPSRPSKKSRWSIPKCLSRNTSKIDLSAEMKSTNLDIHVLFNKFNELYFDDAITFCEIKWIESDDDDHKEKENAVHHEKNHNDHNYPHHSHRGSKKKRKKYAAHYSMDSAGCCCIALERCILKMKSNKYLIETILHHMIHCYILLQSPPSSSSSSSSSITSSSSPSSTPSRCDHERDGHHITIGHSDYFNDIADHISRRSGPHIKLTTNNKQCRQNDDFPSEIIPKQLYLGSVHHALNLKVLETLQITHIVNCTQSIENKFGSQGITYCRVPVNDKASESILHYFVKAIRFIERVRGEQNGKNANRIMIHCHAGISRSSTITIAYLMFSWKMTMFDAIAHVHSKRYQIQPNQGFKNQLLDFYLYLEQNEGNLDDFERIYKPKTPLLEPKGSFEEHMQHNELEAACLPYTQLFGGNGKKNLEENARKRKKSGTKQHFACPVCGKFFTAKMMNRHLDGCIQ